MSNAKSISVKQLRTSFEAQSQNATAGSGRTISRTGGREKIHRDVHGLEDSLNKEDTKWIERHAFPERRIFSEKAHLEKAWKEEAKSEIKTIFEEQNCKWKTTEHSIQELERRLSLLEIEKLKLEKYILQKEATSCSKCHQQSSHVNVKIDGMDCPKGYPCMYISPLFEDWKLNIDYHKRVDTISVQKMWTKGRQSALAEEAGWEKSRDRQTSNFVSETELLVSDGAKAQGTTSKELEKTQAFHFEKLLKKQHSLESTEIADEDWSNHPTRSSSQDIQSSESEHGGDKEDMKYPISHSHSANPTFFQFFDRLDLTDESAQRDIPVISRSTLMLEGSEVETSVKEGTGICGGKGTSLRIPGHEPEIYVVNCETQTLKETVWKLVDACQELECQLQGYRIADSTGDSKQAFGLLSLQKVYMNLLQQICRQLSDVGDDLNSLSRDENYFQQKVFELKEVICASEAEAVPSAKHGVVEDIKLKVQAIEKERDAIAFENIQLLRRLQEVDKEAVEKSKCANELAIMSRELLVLSKSEENELTYWHGKLTELQQVVEHKCLEISKLSEDLEAASKEVLEKDEENQFLRMLYASLRFKLDETKHELEEREATLERLVSHMASNIEDDDEIRPLWGSLRHLHRKDRYKEGQVKHLRIMVEALEDHLVVMEQIFQTAKSESGHTNAHRFYRDRNAEVGSSTSLPAQQ